jgi:hypothetical protein
LSNPEGFGYRFQFRIQGRLNPLRKSPGCQRVVQRCRSAEALSAVLNGRYRWRADQLRMHL